MADKYQNFIDDFGKKIGGARKDFGIRALSLDDLSNMNADEKLTYVKRDNIWKKPDFEKMYRDGVNPSVLWFINKVRTSITPKIGQIEKSELNDAAKQYIESVTKIRDKAMSLRMETDITEFTNWFIDEFYEANGHWLTYKNNLDKNVISKKTLKTAQMSISECRSGERKDLIGVPEDEVGKVEVNYRYAFLPFDERKMKWCNPYDRKEALMIKSGYSISYYYPDDRTVIINDKSSDYLVVDIISNNVVAAGLPDTLLEEMKDHLITLHQKKYELDRDKDKELSAAEKKSKQSFKMPYLSKIERNGKDYAGELHNTYSENATGQITMTFDDSPVEGHAQGKDYLATFGFKGGEFGNYVNQEERQKCLDYGYNALKDLAVLLNISDKDISLGGNLSIAFGARGRGRAAAHYEPMRQVINLTKMSGAGALAHEWFHALDHFYAYRDKDEKGGKLFSQEASPKDRSPFGELIHSLHYKMKDGKEVITDFEVGSAAMDKSFSMDGHGYWSSDCEMLARAFACYIEDKMKEQGMRSDYLSNNADCYGKGVPQGEERKVINSKFDAFFDDLRERGILHKREEEKTISHKKSLQDVKIMVRGKKGQKASVFREPMNSR